MTRRPTRKNSHTAIQVHTSLQKVSIKHYWKECSDCTPVNVQQGHLHLYIMADNQSPLLENPSDTIQIINNKWQAFANTCGKTIYLQHIPFLLENAILQGSTFGNFCKERYEQMTDGTSLEMIQLMVAEVAMVSIDLELQRLLFQGALTETCAETVAKRYGSEAIQHLTGPLKPKRFGLPRFGTDRWIEQVPKLQKVKKYGCTFLN